MIVLTATGLVARGWQKEVGVPSAPPTFLGRGPAGAVRHLAGPTGPPVDISAVDPLAPRYKEWAERAAQYKTTETPRAQTLPFGADRLGRDVLAKAMKGTQTSVFVGLLAALFATADRHRARRDRRLLRRQGRRLPRVALQRLHRRCPTSC